MAELETKERELVESPEEIKPDGGILEEQPQNDELSKEEQKRLKKEQKQAAKQAKKEQKSYIKKKRHPIRNTILIVLVLAIGFGGFKYVEKLMEPIPADTFFLEKKNLSSTISLTGVVESSDMKKVYPKSSGRIS